MPIAAERSAVLLRLQPDTFMPKASPKLQTLDPKVPSPITPRFNPRKSRPTVRCHCWEAARKCSSSCGICRMIDSSKPHVSSAVEPAKPVVPQ